MKIDFTDFKKKDTMQQSEQFEEYKKKWDAELGKLWFAHTPFIDAISKLLVQADIDREAAASEIAFYKELAERSTSKTFPPGIYKGTIEQFEKMIPGFADMMMQHCKPSKPTPYPLLDKTVMYKGIRYGVEIGKYSNGQNKITLIPPPHLKLEPKIVSACQEPKPNVKDDVVYIYDEHNEIRRLLYHAGIITDEVFLAGPSQQCTYYCKLKTTSNEN